VDGMTVEELIAELEKFEPGTVVCVDNGEHVVNIDEVELERFDGWKDKVVLR
jgi:hypothetical protein